MSFKKKVVLGILILMGLYLNRFNLLFLIYESKMESIVSHQKYNYKDLLLTSIQKQDEEEMVALGGYVTFHFLNDYYTQIIYIPLDDTSFAPSCSFEGFIMKKFKKNWYLCKEDWN